MAHSVNSSITASPSFVEAAERGQVSASEGSVRPLPGDRRADPPYTLNCEEPFIQDRTLHEIEVRAQLVPGYGEIWLDRRENATIVNVTTQGTLLS